jgi:hypothetical protein
MVTKKVQRINEESWFFQTINKMNKYLANLTKRKYEKTQISKISDKKGYY